MSEHSPLLFSHAETPLSGVRVVREEGVPGSGFGVCRAEGDPGGSGLGCKALLTWPLSLPPGSGWGVEGKREGTRSQGPSPHSLAAPPLSPPQHTHTPPLIRTDSTWLLKPSACRLRTSLSSSISFPSKHSSPYRKMEGSEKCWGRGHGEGVRPREPRPQIPDTPIPRSVFQALFPPELCPTGPRTPGRWQLGVPQILRCSMCQTGSPTAPSNLSPVSVNGTSKNSDNNVGNYSGAHLLRAYHTPDSVLSALSDRIITSQQPCKVAVTIIIPA